MFNVRNVILAGVVTILHSGPALAQCQDPAGCAAVPSPEIGAGIVGLVLAGGIVRFLRKRTSR